MDTYEPPMMTRFFVRPKAKPWDYVRGRRFKCCGGEGKHTSWCLVDAIYIKGFQEITADQLLYADMEVNKKEG